MNVVYLAGRIPRIVADPRWGGGIDRTRLRDILGCDYAELKSALGIAYRRGAIDFCRDFVVVPAKAAQQRERAA